MKTFFTLSESKVPSDIRARWLKLEELIVGEYERLLLAGVRHVMLGCTLCRQGEIAMMLVGLGLLHGEASALLEWLAEEFRQGEEGSKELQSRLAGEEIFLEHDESNGRPK